MQKHQVSIVKYSDKRENIKKALELCGGLKKIKKIKPSDRVLIKPNLVMWDTIFPYPKYGVVTTSVVMEEMVEILAEAGCDNITIGEGTVENESMGTGVKLAFAGLGYHALQQKYGVKLLDFNDAPFLPVDFGDFKLNIAQEALETDFIVNLPVLKTHNSTKVSLGFKNLKGCLDKKSKFFCHNINIPLDDFISRFGEKLYSDIILIDGIYALERGPAVNGKAYRTDVLIASTDMFSADVVGSKVLGYAPEEIEYLKDYAARKGLPLDGSNLEIVGEPVDSVKMPLKWDWEWKADNSGPNIFERLGISGIYYPKYDVTICSGCSFLNNMLLILVIGAYDGTPFPEIEFLSGKERLSKGGYEKTFLFGNCIIKANRNNPKIKQAVQIKGCPPTVENIVSTLRDNGIRADIEVYRQYRQSIADRYKNRPEFKEEHFSL